MSASTTTGVDGRFVSRSELLVWINGLLDLHISSLDDLKTGAVHCLLLDAAHPTSGVVNLRKVDLRAKFDYDWKSNWRVVQEAFRKLKVAKEVPTKDLVRGIPSTLLEFTQFMYAHCHQHMASPSSDGEAPYDPAERRRLCKGARKLAGTRFRGVAGSGYASPRAVKSKENFQFPSNAATAPVAAGAGGGGRSSSNRRPTPKSVGAVTAVGAAAAAPPNTSPYQPSKSASVPTTPKLPALPPLSSTSSSSSSSSASSSPTSAGAGASKSKSADASSSASSSPRSAAHSRSGSRTGVVKSIRKRASRVDAATAAATAAHSAEDEGTSSSAAAAAADAALREEISALRDQVAECRSRNAECREIVGAMRAEKDFYMRKAVAVAGVLGQPASIQSLSASQRTSIIEVLQATYTESST